MSLASNQNTPANKALLSLAKQINGNQKE